MALAQRGRALRVVVVDDHAPTRTGIRLALQAERFDVAAETGDAAQAVAAVARERPDACLIAVDLRDGGIATAARIHAEAPGTSIVMLGSAPDEHAFFAALEAGASGYLLKDIEPRCLVEALRGVARGEAAIPRSLVARLVAEFRARSRDAGAHAHRVRSLSPREARVLELLVEGRDTAAVASALAISPTTVRRHRSSIVAKLELEPGASPADVQRAWARLDSEAD